MSVNTEKCIAQETMEGDGVIVKRLMPVAGLRNFDPFVLWDHFNISPGNGFPDHPHRGFEAITYMFSGSMQHTDNLGNQSTVTAGGAQRFTAGSGIVHSEMPGDSGKNEGIQLWINLPIALKNIPAAYQQVNTDDIPVQVSEGVTVRTIVGENSPVLLKTPVRYQDIELDENVNYTDQVAEGFRGFIFVVTGKAVLNGQEINEGEAVFVEAPCSIDLQAVEASRFMLCLGKPHNEPIHQHGPYVD